MTHTSKIFLIGPRACGKTSLGKELAKALAWHFVDTDALLQEKAKCSITDFIKKHGWTKFRELESTILQEITQENCIVSTGGGIVLREENRLFMRRTGHAFFLYVPAQILVERLSLNPDHALRPSLTGKGLLEETEEVLRERLPLYMETAHTSLDGTKNITTLIQDILALLV